MGTTDEKAKLTLWFKDRASKGVKALGSEWGKLVGAIGAGSLVASGVTASLGAMKKGIDQLVSATKVAARIQVLNRVMKLTGQNAGYTASQLEANKQAVMSLGIAESEALTIQQRFIQSQLDIADATKIARAAQDLAVIAGTNSSDTAIQLTDALVKQRPILLKQFGIIADLNDIYGRQADALGITIDGLDETQKRQAFLNEILRQSKTVAGAYESAMMDVGKRMTSLPRHFQAAQNAIGKHFLPVLGQLVDGATDSLKAITRLASSDVENLVRGLGKFNRAAEKMSDNAEHAEALKNEYARLLDVSEPTATQQERMKTILGQLEKIYPGLVLQVQNYSGAMQISLDTLNNLLDAEERQAKSKERQKLEEVADAYTELIKKRDEATEANVRARAVVMSMQNQTDEQRQAIETTTEALRQAKGMVGSYSENVGNLNEQITYLNDQHESNSLEGWRSQVGETAGVARGYTEEMSSITTALSTMLPDLASNKEAQLLLGDALAQAVISMQAMNAEAALAKANSLVPTTMEQVAAYKELAKGIDDILTRQVSRREAWDWEQQAIRHNRDLEKESMEIGLALMEDEAEARQDNIDTRREQHETVTQSEIAATMNSIRYRKNAEMQFAAEMGSITIGGVNRMVGAMMDGRTQLSDIFKDMAEDFVKYFITKALATVADTFIPGLGAVLGGIFDTPANDRMAMTQGQHFAQFFTAGALNEMQRFPGEFATTASGSGVYPALAGAAGGGTVEVHFHGPITDRDFVRNSVVPEIEAAIKDGRSQIAINPMQETGSRNGRQY